MIELITQHIWVELYGVHSIIYSKRPQKRVNGPKEKKKILLAEKEKYYFVGSHFTVEAVVACTKLRAMHKDEHHHLDLLVSSDYLEDTINLFVVKCISIMKTTTALIKNALPSCCK